MQITQAQNILRRNQRKTATLNADWQLMLDFHVDEASQSWSLVRRKDGIMTAGHGNPSEIAHSVCAIAKQTGGSVIN